MASIFDRFGIKEVADVTFYDIETDKPVLYLDTLKVSTVETTGEQSEAKGGKGNSSLLIWDFGREITLNLEDALFSPASMAIMFGDTLANAVPATRTVKRNTDYSPTANGTLPSKVYKKTGEASDAGDTTVVWYAPGSSVATTAGIAGEYYIGEYSFSAVATLIQINAAKFPGTYKIVGDTYRRNEKTGKDEIFQFIVPKAKMSSETTLTLQADGDPTTFSMSMRVLRPADGNMLQLVQYDIA